jgi:hypothetical protein
MTKPRGRSGRAVISMAGANMTFVNRRYRSENRTTRDSSGIKGPILVVGLALAAPWGTGCGDLDASESEFEVAGIERALTGGTLVTSNTNPYSSAVNLGGCTGTKIGARRFLTAAHCHGVIFALAGGGTLTVSNQLDSSSPISLQVNRFYFHPTFVNVFDTVYDVAVIDVLTDSPGIPSLAIDTTALPTGATATFVGYGGADSFAPNNSGKKQTMELSSLSLSQFKAVAPGQTAFREDVFAHYNVFNGGPEGAFKSNYAGDSGGPLLRRRNGTWRVVGTMSFRNVGSGTSPASVLSMDTRVANVASWITSTTPAIKAQPGSITNLLSGKCLSAAGSTAVGSVVTQEVCDIAAGTADTQYWQRLASTSPPAVRFRNGKSGLCITAGSQSNAIQVPCDSNDGGQIWSITTSGRLVGLFGEQLAAFGQGQVVLTSSTENGNSRVRWLLVNP